MHYTQVWTIKIGVAMRNWMCQLKQYECYRNMLISYQLFILGQVRKLKRLYTCMVWCSWLMMNVEDDNKNTWHRRGLISIIDKSAAQQVFFQILSAEWFRVQFKTVCKRKLHVISSGIHFSYFDFIRSFIRLACLTNISVQDNPYNGSDTIFNITRNGNTSHMN